MQIASQIMTSDVHTVTPDTSVEKVIHKMAKEGISGLPVIDEKNKLLGIITETDIANHESNPHSPRAISLLGGMIYLDDPFQFNEQLKKICAQLAKDLMTKSVSTVEEDTTLDEIIALMQERNLNRLPVVDKEGHLKGIITRTDIVKALEPKVE